MKIAGILKKICLIFGLLVALFFFTTSQTDGFTENKIFKTIRPPSAASCQFPALQQKFSYFAHGTQSFALLSEDGEFVLKFFRNDRASHPLRWCSCFLPPRLRKRLDQTLEKRQKRQQKSFKSYQIAYQHLAKETGLLHDPSILLDTEVTFTDKIGVVHHLSLKNVPFLLQKRASPFYPTLLSWIHEGKLDVAKEGLSELVHLLKTRCEKGIFDKDPDLETNFGWVDGHPIQTDVGRFSLDESRKNPEVYRIDLLRITDRTQKWLLTHAPDLARHLKEEVEAL